MIKKTLLTILALCILFTTVGVTSALSSDAAVNIPAPYSAVASGSCGENVTWSLSEDGTLTISGYGDMSNYAGVYTSNTTPWYELRDKIKTVVVSEGVTTIGAYALYNCWNLTSISIPESVTTIGDSAFYGCSSLKSIAIPDSVTTIGSSAFYDCRYLTSISIPDGVTSIGDYTFIGCGSLTSITLPNGVTTIGDSAFYKCSSLTSITIPNSVTTIGDSAFFGCNNLKEVCYDGTKEQWNSITIGIQNAIFTYVAVGAVEGSCGENVTWSFGDNGTITISGYGDMSDYTSNTTPWLELRGQIKTVVISEGVTTIGAYAFYNCDSLTSISIPDSVTTIGSSAFYNCNSLTSITLPYSVTTIGTRAFFECSSLTSITLPNSVTIIGDSAFYGCNNLKEVDYDGTEEQWNSITIGDVNSNLTNLILFETKGSWGENVTWILDVNGTLTISGYGDMTNYTLNDIPWYELRGKIKTVVISEGVTSIGDGAFEGCSNLTSITIPNSVTTIGHSAFYYCGKLTSIAIPDSVTTIGNLVFSHCSSLTSITIPNSVTSIGASAFEGCSGLTSITLSNSVTTIGSRAFYECSSLTSISIPNSVTSIGDWAFYYCSNLTSISISDGVKTIGEFTFFYCNNLTSITLPNSVTTIGRYAFFSCSSLTSITIPDSVTSIGASAFSDCSSLTSITIPDSVTSIGSDMFSGCSSLTSITIPNSVTSIGGYAFFGCSSLTSITIPNSVTTIGNSAFFECSSLTSITISNSVTSIGTSVFEGCSNLTSITLPNSVTTIGSRAFYNCSSLTSITIPNSVTSIGDWAFYNCSSLTSITLPNSVTTIADYAFYGCSNLKEVHYYGTKEQWNSITIGAGNSNLTDATLFVAKGSCGENVYWTLEDGTLIIFGTGKMSNYTSSSNPPWSNFIDQVVTINISEGVHNISNRAFATAKNLKTVNIASTVTSIGSYAFANCTELETVNMYGNCSLINIYAFNGCGSLKNINVSGTRNDFDNLTISRGNLNFERASITYSSPEGVIHASMSIYARWFYDENTKELTISNYPYVASKNMLNYSKVESLPWYEFIDEIETIKADGVLSIGSRTAINAPNLHAIEIGETVARINAWAFFGCSSLESIKFPASLKKIGTGAFNGVGSVTSLTYNSNIENYDNILFGNNNTVFERTKVTATDGVRGYHGGNIRWYVTGNTLTFKGKGDMRSISSSTATAWYPYKDTITNIVIDEGINNICSGAFTGFSVTSVEIPSSLRKVGAYAFKDCGNLTQIIYNGTAENFNSISLGGGNVPFKNATIVYEN